MSMGGRFSTGGLVVTVMASLALAACGGGGGASPSSAGGSGAPSSPPPPAPPPPPASSDEINRAFHFNPLVSYTRTRPNYGGEYEATAVAIGDVTGDGLPDVTVVTGGTFQTSELDLIGVVMVFPQRSDKTLGDPIKLAYTDDLSGNYPSVAVADLDRDGTKEILVGFRKGLSIVKYRPESQSLHSTEISDPQGYSALATLDADGDGKLDVIAHTGQVGAVLYLGDGAGGLSRSKEIATPLAGINRVIARDMNNDTKPDLVMTNGQGFQAWYLMLNDGHGNFGPVNSYDLPRRQSDNWPWMAWGVDTSDFNRDGRKDVVVSLKSNRPAGIGIYLANQSGGYVLDRVLESYDLPETVVVADFDGNGRDDIVTLHGGWFNMGYYLQGSNGFEPEVLFSIAISSNPTSHYMPESLAVGDVNSDGCMDIAIADTQYGLLVVTGASCKK